METSRFAIGDYQIGRVTQLPAINYAYPLVGPAGAVEGVVFAAQSLNWLTAALSNVAFPPGAILVVTDRNGTVLARMPDAGDWIGKTLPEQQVLAMVSSQKEGGVFEADDAHGVSRLWAHAPLIAGLDLHATMGASKSVAFADINRRLIRNLAGLGLATIVALGRRVVRRQIHPSPDRCPRCGNREAGIRRTRRAGACARRPQRTRTARAMRSTAWPQRCRRETGSCASRRKGPGKPRSSWR